MNPTESMAAASHGLERWSEKRSSIEAKRLVSRCVRPSNATLAARRAGSRISTSIWESGFRTAWLLMSSQNELVPGLNSRIAALA